MSKILMLSGLPASGKSTKAEEIVQLGGNWVRVNKDLLRTMLHFDKFTHNNEKFTQKAEHALADSAVCSGLNVVVDDTNLGDKHLNSWQYLTSCLGADFEHVNVDTPWHECIERDQERHNRYGNGVGRHVIMNMAMQYSLIPEMKNIVVVDIDGTVADVTHRLKYVKQDPKDWKSFFSQMSFDTPRMDVYNKASDLAVANDAEIVFVSARPEDYRDKTQDWLYEHGMDYMHLLMRPRNDKRPDTEVKQNIYNKFLANYNVIKVFDDRPSVVRMWESLDLDVEDVGSGKEF